MDLHREETHPQSSGKVIRFAGYTGNGRSQITQAELRAHLELASAFKIARRRYTDSKASPLRSPRSGCPIEPGFLTAAVLTRARPGYTVEPYEYEELLVGC